MTRTQAALITLSCSPVAAACPWCRPSVDAAIYGDDFWRNVGIALLPFAVVAIVVVVIERLSTPPVAVPGTLTRR